MLKLGVYIPWIKKIFFLFGFGNLTMKKRCFFKHIFMVHWIFCMFFTFIISNWIIMRSFIVLITESKRQNTINYTLWLCKRRWRKISYPNFYGTIMKNFQWIERTKSRGKIHHCIEHSQSAPRCKKTFYSIAFCSSFFLAIARLLFFLLRG